MKPFMLSHSETAQNDVRALSQEEIAMIAGGTDAIGLGPEHDDTQLMCKGSDGVMTRDGVTTDTRG